VRLNILLVTFALRNPQRDYESFFVTLRGTAFQWWHFLDQTYIVVTQFTPKELRERLVPQMEPTDHFLIVPVDPQQADGWLPKTAWEWMVQTGQALQKQLPE
jgi:hypothetical protein